MSSKRSLIFYSFSILIVLFCYKSLYGHTSALVLVHLNPMQSENGRSRPEGFLLMYPDFVSIYDTKDVFEFDSESINQALGFAVLTAERWFSNIESLELDEIVELVNKATPDLQVKRGASWVQAAMRAAGNLSYDSIVEFFGQGGAIGVYFEQNSIPTGLTPLISRLSPGKAQSAIYDYQLKQHIDEGASEAALEKLRHLLEEKVYVSDPHTQGNSSMILSIDRFQLDCQTNGQSVFSSSEWSLVEGGHGLVLNVNDGNHVFALSKEGIVHLGIQESYHQLIPLSNFLNRIPMYIAEGPENQKFTLVLENGIVHEYIDEDSADGQDSPTKLTLRKLEGYRHVKTTSTSLSGRQIVLAHQGNFSYTLQINSAHELFAPEYNLTFKFERYLNPPTETD